MQRSGADLVLDVAAGTGHAARQIAPSVRAVVALDVTTEMLQRGHRAALEDGHGNIVFQRGDAADLPFLDDSFDLVVCRFALHHFDDVAPVVREMRRCARPGALVVVADLVGHDDEAVHRRQDGLERLRDPTHTETLTASQLAEALAASGLVDVDVERRRTDRPLTPWLEQTSCGPATTARIRDALSAELAGGPATGFEPRRSDEDLHFAQYFASALARNP